MRKYESLAFSAAAALTLFLTASCQKEIAQTSEVSSASCTVEFSMNEMATKTAMGEPDGSKYPTIWSNDDNKRITFYQNDKKSTSVTISTDDQYKTASFTAIFPEDKSTSFTYKAILAGKRTANDLPVVPAEQHPIAGSFDPDANVLVGVQKQFDSKPTTTVDLVYKHAAVISRVCFTGIPDGLTIYGVQINAANAIAGAATSVDYTNGTVDFSGASEKTISLIYDKAPEYSNKEFNAYFVAIPGTEVQINDIKLITDKGTFVKKNNSGSKTGFDVNKLKSVKVAVPSERTFYKATSIEAGQNYLIVTDNSGKHALSNESGSAADTEVSVSDDDSIVLSDPSNLLWNASASENFTLKNGDYFIYYTTSYNSNKISLKNTQSLTFNYAGTEFSTKIGSDVRHLYYSTSNGWYFGSSQYTTNIFTSKLPLNLSFSVTEASYDIDESKFIDTAPILNGASSDVKYESSNTAVATVDSNGNIEAKSVGTTTITASLASNSLYQAATASYTLNVIDPSKVVTYELANTIESGATYLIVSPAKQHVLCYTSNDTKSNYSGWDCTSGTLVVNESLKDCEFVITQSGDNYTIYNTENKKYLYTKTNYGDTYIGFQTNNYNFTLDARTDDLFSFKSPDKVGNPSNDAWLYYKTSDSCFKIGGSGKPSTSGSGVYLYKYKDPRTPQNLTFADYTPTIDLASKNTYEQEVEGDETTVTYSISATPSDAATIDATTGKVTATEACTATITATAAATDKFQPASAFYTLTVIDSNKKYYRKVSISNLSELTSGQYLLCHTSTGSSSKYLFDVTASDFRRKQEIPSNDQIAQTSELDKLLVTFEAGSADKFYVHTTKGYLGRGSSSSSSPPINIDESKNREFTITLSNGQISMTTQGTSDTYKLCYSSSKFSYSSSSTATAAQFDLYLLDGSRKQSRNLSFAEQAVQKDINDSDFTNTLTGIIDGTTVTYSSSKTDVATVDANGKVTLKGVAGTTIITASTLEDATYRACSATYTLTVIDPDAVAYYTKVTSALPTKGSWDKVLFVYDNGNGTGYAFKGIYDGDAKNAPNGKTEENSSYLIEAGNAVQVSITTSGIVSTSEIDACTLTLEFTTEDRKHYLKMNAVNGYFRILESNNDGKSDAGKFVVMCEGGYRMSYSEPTDETNNFTAKRGSYYFGFNSTSFASQKSEAKFSIYRIVE